MGPRRIESAVLRRACQTKERDSLGVEVRVRVHLHILKGQHGSPPLLVKIKAMKEKVTTHNTRIGTQLSGWRCTAQLHMLLQQTHKDTA